MKNIASVVLILLAIAQFSCSPDDNRGDDIQLRDPVEVWEENKIEIQTFLETHYYEIEENAINENARTVIFKEITEENNETPIIQSEFLISETVTVSGIDYELYQLQFREGNPERRKPTFADSVLVTYHGQTIRKTIFDSSPSPIWLDNTENIIGFREGLTHYRGAGGFTENPDGTFIFDEDFGFGVVFIPSGLGYFGVTPIGSGIFSYEPIIFTYQLYRSRESDHDRDGIPNWLEDVNETRDVQDVDTDANGIPNYLDTDDDGDGVPTREEVEFDEDGNLILPFPDSNGNGTPDHLDPTWPEDENA